MITSNLLKSCSNLGNQYNLAWSEGVRESPELAEKNRGEIEKKFSFLCNPFEGFFGSEERKFLSSDLEVRNIRQPISAR